MTNKNKKFKSGTVDTNYLPGDIGLERSKGWLPAIIRFFMNLYKKAKKLPEAKETYNHVFTIIDVNGVLYVAEALASGVNIKPFSTSYATKTNVKYKTPSKPYSAEEKQKISILATNMVFKPHRYDFAGLLLWQPLLILTGRWLGPKGNNASKRVYCSELGATLSNLVRANTFKDPFAVNPADIDANKYYRDKIIS